MSSYSGAIQDSPTQKQIGVCIIGGTGFGAGELLRLSIGHPLLEVCSVVSQSESGTPISAAHPHLNGFFKGDLDSSPQWEKLSKYDRRVVVVALPHGRSGSVAAQLFMDQPIADLKIVDLSGDLRLRDLDLHKRFYGSDEIPVEVRNQAVYGLSEINRDLLGNARLIANPGCLATAAILAISPISALGMVASVDISAVTGSSGAGKKTVETVHHAIRHANFGAYKVLAHQHEPEIAQASGVSNINFVSHRAPISRGIFATCFLHLNCELSIEKVREIYANFYAGSKFIRLLNEESPEVENVVGSNFCDLSVSIRGRTVVTMVAIDNLIKGMAGAAIQNINLMFGLPEETGLWHPSVRPV